MIRRYLPLLATLALLVIGYVICAFEFKNFLSFRVIGNLLTDNAFLGITAVGMTFAVISGGIDLSVGSVIAFTTILIAVLVQWYGVHPLAAFAVALAVGALIGAGMGSIIHYLRLPPFIVTLTGMFLIRGISFQISTESIGIDHEFYATLTDFGLRIGRGKLSLLAMIMLAVVAAGTVLLHRMRFGANVYAIGGNIASAKLMGVPVPSTTVRIYMLSSTLAALAGIVFSLYTTAGNSLNCVGVELDAIASVVIGGTLLTGGYGFMVGTLAGVLLQGLIQTFITFDGTLSSWWTKIIIGILLFSFILLQRLITKFGQKK
ncbi:MAG: sugar ABC transporter permease YjfF [Deltaproteobacteria bacterium]|jgi:simple sugar transport system permease protein|nr:sugar ABC transporter permease YjfF [Deltaproteobacteria bacterium]